MTQNPEDPKAEYIFRLSTHAATVQDLIDGVRQELRFPSFRSDGTDGGNVPDSLRAQALFTELLRLNEGLFAPATNSDQNPRLSLKG